MELELVEERFLARLGVPDDRRRALRDAEPASGEPRARDAGGAARRLDAGPFVRHEELLPRDVDAGRERALIPESLRGEERAHRRVERREETPAVDERRRPPLARRGEAEEEDAPREAVLVRALVVEEDRAVRRVGRRAVDLPSLRLARQVAVVAEERRPRRLREGLQVPRAGELEADEEERPVAREEP